jgi:tetratricopeptide (TPR) repeat protein
MRTPPLGPDSLSEHFAPLPRPSLRSLISGAEIIGELPERFSAPFWEAYRQTHLWASTPRPRRQQLADPEGEPRWAAEVLAAGIPELEPQLMLIGQLFSDPARVDPLRVSVAMRAIALWCDQHGYPRTAALLAEAAAYATPGDLEAVYLAGRSATRAGWEAESESWYRYGLTLARRRRNEEEKALFLGSLGNYYHRRGNLRLAERLHMRALRSARRVRAEAREAAALQDLCLLLADRGKLGRAEAAALEAATIYGSDHPMLPVLMHDLAYAWMVHGRFDAAYPLMEAVLPHLSRPDQRVRVIGNLARAAGGRGDRDRFERAWRELAETVSVREHESAWADPLSDALREAAQGALTLGDHGRTQWALDHAEPLARQAGRGLDRMQLDAIRSAAASRTTAAPDSVTADASHPEMESVRAAEAFVELLARRTVPA